MSVRNYLFRHARTHADIGASPLQNFVLPALKADCRSHLLILDSYRILNAHDPVIATARAVPTCCRFYRVFLSQNSRTAMRQFPSHPRFAEMLAILRFTAHIALTIAGHSLNLRT